DGAKVARATFDAGAAASRFNERQEVSLTSKDKAVSAMGETIADGKGTVRIASGAAAGDEAVLTVPKKAHDPPPPQRQGAAPRATRSQNATSWVATTAMPPPAT